MNKIRTPLQIYRELVIAQTVLLATHNTTLSFDTLTRRANIYAVKNTWKVYNEQFKIKETHV